MKRLAALLACAFSIAACGGDRQTETSPRSESPPIILISVDTLRSDRLPAYGYHGVATPAIDALRRDGVLFERAYSHYPITLPSHVSLLTGLLPTEHGVRDNIGYRLDSSEELLAPYLRDRGYHTGAAVSAWVLRSESGLGEGFDFYEDRLSLRGGVSLGESQRPGSETLERAVEWLDSLPPEDPFFLFLHFYEPHTPYEPPEPFASRYADPYDGEIAASDALVGQVVDELRRLGRYDDSLVIFLSDHGEGLGDHGEMEHGILLHREVIQVPLIVKLPGGEHAGRSVAVPAALEDVAPTVRALLGSAVDEVTLVDLLGPDPPSRKIYSETYYPRLHLGWSDLASLVDERFHYIEGPAPELFDLAVDGEEERNVMRSERRVFSQMREVMASLRTELAAPTEVDQEAGERLAALGYLSSVAAPAEGPLPDPKSRLPTLDVLFEAFRFFAQKDFPAAIDGFRRVLAENPGMIDAWEHLGQALHQVGDFQKAEEAFGEALERSGGADHVALSAARLFFEQERWAEARSHAELALATNPATAHQLLAEIAFAAKDLEAAERHARASLAERPEGIASRLVLAQVEAGRGRLQEARQLVAEAEAEEARRYGDETTPGLYFVRGDIEARLGEGEAARASFEEEIRRNPQDTRPYCRLAVVHAVEGRGAEAIGSLQRMVEANPRPAAYVAAVETFRTLGDEDAARALLQHALRLFPGDPLLASLARGDSPS